MAVEKKQPMRQCIGCREMKEKKSLIRIVHNEEGFFVDRTGKKNGRGAYLCNDEECLKKAAKSKGLERSLKISVPKDVYENLRLEMSKE